jgi:hypothetical protein
LTAENASPIAQLMATHPRLFRGQAPMCWSEVQSGWWCLADEVCSGIERQLTAEELAHFQVLQIKEKFGGLRLYWRLQPCEHATFHGVEVQDGEIFGASAERSNTAGVDAIQQLVRVAYDASLRTCKICGCRLSTGADNVCCQRH